MLSSLFPLIYYFDRLILVKLRRYVPKVRRSSKHLEKKFYLKILYCQSLNVFLTLLTCLKGISSVGQRGQQL